MKTLTCTPCGWSGVLAVGEWWCPNCGQASFEESSAPDAVPTADVKPGAKSTTATPSTPPKASR